ncbi:hypothetical protein IGX72_000787 [Escherichia coli]|nr:hypothetical protein [Escherichia coli]
MNYLEFPDGSLFWQQTTYLRGIMKSTTEIQLSDNVIQAGAKKLLDELGHEMPGLWDLWDLKERNIEDAVVAIWQEMNRASEKRRDA